jgi:hypothetical protein
VQDLPLSTSTSSSAFAGGGRGKRRCGAPAASATARERQAVEQTDIIEDRNQGSSTAPWNRAGSTRRRGGYLNPRRHQRQNRKQPCAWRTGHAGFHAQYVQNSAARAICAEAGSEAVGRRPNSVVSLPEHRTYRPRRHRQRLTESEIKAAADRVLLKLDDAPSLAAFSSPRVTTLSRSVAKKLCQRGDARHIRKAPLL